MKSEDEARESLVYSYTGSFNAFAAKLSVHEAEELSRVDGIVSVFPNRYRQLHTTKSWDFIGFPQNSRRKLEVEGDIIVGVIDTGITPQSESFSDVGFGPPPPRWKGSCGHYANFSGCNNKLIGARYFKLDGAPAPGDILSPVDVHGHGTHTSSTIAGNAISGANLFGLAQGTARGAVPAARVSAYKVCWARVGCSDMDILAAFESAINDGVDVISISIGGTALSYLEDSIAIGSFHAMKKGILTVASAGNDGPSLGSVANHAPWLLTVAASGTDRQFQSRVELGNRETFLGVGINAFEPNQKLYPLMSGADAARNSSTSNARYCMEDAMESTKVKGKLVYCRLGVWGADSVVKGIGGAGAIIESPLFLDAAPIFMAPATMVNATVGDSIDQYIHSTRSPSAVIYRTEEIQVAAPFVASFSSRGPNPGSQRLLKPDIAAPGVNILASYTPMKTLTGLRGDTQYAKFTIMSGTSMACPHVAGVAAYVKSFHPTWSPAAIRSAIVTTAKLMSRRTSKDGEFAYGAGQVNPTRACNPGLIYDMDEMSYIQFLCQEGYHGSSLSVLVGPTTINCSSLLPGLSYDSLNYPTMQMSTRPDSHGVSVAMFQRTVTNVGPPQAVYNATVRTPKGVSIVVKPLILSFSRKLQKRSFKVVVRAAGPFSSSQMVSGWIIWTSQRHVVRSPVVVYALND
ncbi:hypothetical protein SAY86_000830 [Trapa natans]|uniref:Subtilisin-like protease SBT4.14 n=1 Tax=Trapa natans TaxID=22666 RepID=A0AAN7MPG8_TRANT|nr:hypothetical protein SAY86_000830 [Trapa natans]